MFSMSCNIGRVALVVVVVVVVGGTKKSRIPANATALL